MVRNREVDVAIITDPDPPAGATVIRLDDTAYMAHMRREHRLAVKDKISLDDLQGEHLIVPEDGSLTQIILNRKMGELNLTLPKLIKTRTFPVVKEAVLHGLGIGLILEDSLFPSTGLVAKPIVEMPELYKHCLVIPSDKSDLRAIQRFIEISQYQG